MSFFFFKYLKNRLPSAYLLEFDRKLLISSLYNIELLSWVGFVFFFPLYFLDRMRAQAGEWNEVPVLWFISIVHYALLLLFIPALMARRYLRKVLDGQYSNAISLFTVVLPGMLFLLLFPNFVLTLIARNNLVFYTIFIFCISVSVPFSHRVSASPI